MPQDPFVYISYSRHDSGFVGRLSDDLRRNGVRVWRDVEQIEAGANWEAQVREILADATVMLFVASKNSVASSLVAREVELFLLKRRTVIPLLLDDVDASRMPPSLRALAWVDFRDYDAAIRRLLAVLLPSSVRQDHAVEAQEVRTKGYVFLNYAEEDAEFIQEVREFLRQRSYAYWDYQDSDRDYHSDLDLELEGIIKEAVAMLSILSPDWKSSRWTRKEYLFAEEVGTPVFLLKARDPGPTLIIAGLHFIDFTSDTGVGFSRLAKELDRKGL
jgi:hypothetical protein